MSGMELRGVIALGDQWLARAESAHGGGDHTAAAASAAIASAYYTRAMLQKPDTLGAMLANAGRNDTVVSRSDRALEESLSRHPAGKKRAANPPPEQPKESDHD